MITLAYPTSAPYTIRIQLKNPDLGDSLQKNIKIMHKQNMDGMIYTYKKTNVTDKFLLSFSCLDETEIANLKNFYNLAIGHAIKYTDYDGVNHTCYIASPTLVVTTNRDCSYGAILELLEVRT